MNADLPILAIGDLTAPEFVDAAESLGRCGAVSVADVAGTLAAINDGFAPAVIIIAQRWPGEFAAAHIDALRRAAPLARLATLLGPWLEGETRTGRPPAGSLRVYWHRWAEFSRAFEARSPDSVSSWSHPATSSDDERLLSACDNLPAVTPASTTSGLLIAVVARDRETFQSLADICARRGWHAVWLRDRETETSLHPDVLLLDAATPSENQLSRVARLHAAIGRVPIIAIVGFPRFEDVSRWKAAGAATVISKPFQSQVLLEQIERLVAAPV
jgi:CheY-like chemotaxis protein